MSARTAGAMECKNGRGDASAEGVAARFRALLPEGCHYKLTGRSLKDALQNGRVGKAPGPRNKRPEIPDSFVRSIAQYAQLKQLNGDEKYPRQLIQAAMASAQGTAWAQKLETIWQKRYLLQRVRKEMEIAVTCSKAIDTGVGAGLRRPT